MKWLYIFLFVSGATGLIYQVVWTRMLLLVFGVSTVSIVVVVVTFMAGLAAGSWVFGKTLAKSSNPLRAYGLIELGIGLFAGLTPFFVDRMTLFYKFFYLQSFPSEHLLVVKILLSSLIIFLPTFFMGGTIPAIVSVFHRELGGKELPKTFGRIYAMNTFGAMFGVILSAYVLIELLGLRLTVWGAMVLNLLVGGSAIFMSVIARPAGNISFSQIKASIGGYSFHQVLLLFVAVCLSGLTSMSYEILWTRLLTPIVGTYVYAFALILTLYLLGIVLGAALFQRYFHKNKKVLLLLGIMQMLIAVGAFSSIFVVGTFYPSSVLVITALVVLPTTVLMGISFPVVANLTRTLKESTAFIGKIYAVSTFGGLLGPVVAGFLLLPVLGTGKSILVLALINVFLGIILVQAEDNVTLKIKMGILALGLTAVAFVGAFYFWKPNYFHQKNLKAYLGKFRLENYHYTYLEDSTASVLGYKNRSGDDSGLLVDGVGITILVDDTKLMAHIPLLLHPDPKDVLVIAFGMGTTFRSAMSYGIRVDAVDLVPSVPKMFSIFFSDAARIMEDKRGKIYVDDGRNFVFLTDNKYDLITVDPPPPVNSAGTTVLYSRDFYRQSKSALKKDGLFTQWVTLAREDDYKMLVRSFIDEFPYVLAFSSPRKAGLFLVGSTEKTEINLERMKNRLQNAKIFADLNEWGKWSAENIVDLYRTDREGLAKFVGDAPAVTDDRPGTEYFLLRHNFRKAVEVPIDLIW